MELNQFKKVLKSLKVPAAAVIYQPGGQCLARWVKKGGHAGSTSIARVRTAALANGFKNSGDVGGVSGDGASVTGQTVLIKGEVAVVLGGTYGVTASDNRFIIEVKTV